MNSFKRDNNLDFNLIDHGTVFEFKPTNSEALAFAKIRLGINEWQWNNDSFFINYPKVSSFCLFLVNSGFKLH